MNIHNKTSNNSKNSKTFNDAFFDLVNNQQISDAFNYLLSHQDYASQAEILIAFVYLCTTYNYEFIGIFTENSALLNRIKPSLSGILSTLYESVSPIYRNDVFYTFCALYDAGARNQNFEHLIVHWILYCSAHMLPAFKDEKTELICCQIMSGILFKDKLHQNYFRYYVQYQVLFAYACVYYHPHVVKLLHSNRVIKDAFIVDILCAITTSHARPLFIDNGLWRTERASLICPTLFKFLEESDSKVSILKCLIPITFLRIRPFFENSLTSDNMLYYAKLRIAVYKQSLTEIEQLLNESVTISDACMCLIVASVYKTANAQIISCFLRHKPDAINVETAIFRACTSRHPLSTIVELFKISNDINLDRVLLNVCEFCQDTENTREIILFVIKRGADTFKVLSQISTIRKRAMLMEMEVLRQRLMITSSTH